MTNKMKQYHKCESCNYYNGINRCLLRYILTTDQNTCNKWKSRLLDSDDDELGKQDCPYPNNCPHPYGTYETCLKCKANSDNKSVVTSSKNTETQGNDRWLLYFGQNMAIPSAQPNTGHWIAQDIYNCHTDFKCSECGYIHSFMHLYGKPTADYTYCPSCGAKMIEPQESEEV